MLHFEGTREFEQGLELVWSAFSDARNLAQCVPGAEAVKEATEDAAACVLRPGFAFIRGTLDMTLRITERTPMSAVRLQNVSKGIGSSAEVDIRLSLVPIEKGTQVSWTADVVQLGGLLKAVPQGLIQAAAQRVIEDSWTKVAEKLKKDAETKNA